MNKPQVLKGFNDWFSEDVKLRKYVIGILEETFEKYGYEPLETPALELSEFMLGQSGEEAEKQYYRFKDQGRRDVMLKYEVMIAMCRAVATNFDKMVFPYKRYQIQPVWRAENTQKGRYRQFTQADADTIGTSSLIADAEFIQMGLEITQKIGFKNFVARISNRKFLEGLREYLEIDEDKFYGMCMAIDKLKKIGIDGVKEELSSKRGIPSAKVELILETIDSTKYQKLDNFELINYFLPTIGKSKTGNEGLNELKEIFDYLKKVGVLDKLVRFDPSLARGLSSYTGPVWEFEVIDGGVGSIAGCGRYDNSIGKYMGKDIKIPATGGSFGIERICDILKDRGMLNLGETNIKVLVSIFSPEFSKNSILLSKTLRDSNINTLLYPDPEAKLKKQFVYADKKLIPYVIVIGPEEIKENKITLKNLKSKTQSTISLNETIDILKSLT